MDVDPLTNTSMLLALRISNEKIPSPCKLSVEFVMALTLTRLLIQVMLFISPRFTEAVHGILLYVWSVQSQSVAKNQEFRVTLTSKLELHIQRLQQ